jgi:hypothetical protein
MHKQVDDELRLGLTAGDNVDLETLQVREEGTELVRDRGAHDCPSAVSGGETVPRRYVCIAQR